MLNLSFKSYSEKVLPLEPTWHGADYVHGSLHGRILYDGIGQLDSLTKASD